MKNQIISIDWFNGNTIAPILVEVIESINNNLYVESLDTNTKFYVNLVDTIAKSGDCKLLKKYNSIEYARKHFYKHHYSIISHRLYDKDHDYTGWISPGGIYYFANFLAHSALANSLCINLLNEMPKSLAQAEGILFSNIWIKIWDDGEGIQVNVHDEITAKQIESLGIIWETQNTSCDYIGLFQVST